MLGNDNFRTYTLERIQSNKPYKRTLESTLYYKQIKSDILFLI